MNLNENIHRIKQVMGLNEMDLSKWFSFNNNNTDNDLPDEESERERFTCTDCGEYDYKMYMVNKNIWEKIW